VLSEKQEILIRKTIEILVDMFLNNNYTIKEMSQITKIPSSTIQRYLNDTERIKQIYPNSYFEIINKIKSKLEYNKLLGKIRGGTNYAANNESLKDEKGHFTGSKKL